MKFNSAVCIFSLWFFAIGLSSTRAQQSLIFTNLTVENGLSQNSVMAIAQDSTGLIWLGTRQGVNRYDGYHFKNYSKHHTNKKGNEQEEITSLITDYLGTLWAGTTNGLQKYNLKKDRFEKVEQLHNQLIELLFQDDQHNLWVGTQRGLKLLVDRNHYKFKTFLFSNKIDDPINNIYTICKDKSNHFWVGTGGGLIQATYKKGIFSFKKISFIKQGMSGYITAIAKDSNQNTWVGTSNGLYLLNNSGQLSKTFVHTEGNKSSLVHNDIRELMPDKNGAMWIGTQNGLSIFNPKSNSFFNYQHDPETTGSISHNSIHHLFKDRTQNIWIGTYFGGVNVIYPVSTKFKIYRNGKSSTSISGNVVSGIAEGKPNQLWIGTEGAGINLLNKTSYTFSSYKHDPANFSSISSNLVKVLAKDKYNPSNVIIGTHRGVINILNTATGKFQRIENVKDAKGTIGSAEIIALAYDMDGLLWIGSLNGLSTLQSKNGVYPSKTLRSPLNSILKNKGILNLFVDSKNNLWIGTSTNLFRYNLRNKKLNNFSQANSLDSLQSDYINCVTESKNGDILVGTNSGGLSIYNAESNTFKSYTENNGLINNNVLGIVEDNSGNLWISTANGLSEFNPLTKRFRNYTKSDGLAGNEFNNRSYFKDSQGEIFFGGINGLTSFFPSEIQSNNYVSPLVFTSLRLFNKLVEVDEENGILNNNLNLIDELDFSYDQNNFTIEFSLLNYVKPDKNRYAYKLEGYDKDWKYDSTPIASYTNLPSGNYRFVVKGNNNDGIPGSAMRTLNIHIKPAPWLSWWAYLCYFIILSSILFLTLRYFFIRALLKRTENVQQMKLQFFTHVSHEIRTPLTLILGPLESLLKNTTHLPELHKQVVPIKNNADRLLRLVTELMDFRKTETGNMKLHLEEVDVVQFMQRIFDAFKDLAFSKHINYRIDTPTEPIKIWIDSIQLEKVFYNLLSNAFKFTKNNGNISVTVKEFGQQIAIEVRDNGIGIPEASKDKLFSDFFQIESSGSNHIGSGIGLALSKSIVVAHGGKITIESRRETAEKRGDTKFTVTLNKGQLKVDANAEKPESISNGNTEETHVHIHTEPAITEKMATYEETVLLVEDNREIRTMLCGFLSPFYHVIEAENGQLGWETATEQLPDLVICDIMMPVMDGLALCGNLKTDGRTAHIPVILLTAMDSHLQKVDGLETGADIYITKPFSTELLLLNVRNLLQARKAMRKKYTEEVNLKPQDITINKTDHEFMLKVVQFVDNKMADQDFVIQDLADEVGMSQPVLYKKIRAVTDLSVNDFIKSIRLKKALSLLETNQYTISEISYLVGFNDAKYFSREFKKQFGDTPKSYLKKSQPNNI
jgi:ligand-binding sensor domain-containing protein/DNA-binding response OmpR family regulator/two-component sensor histidine kinase